MNTVGKILLKIRHGLVLHEISGRLGRIGVRIVPYYLNVESLEHLLPSVEVGFEEYEVHFLGPEEVKEIASIPERRVSEEELLTRLRNGKMCLGAKFQGQIVACLWCDFEECNFEGHRFSLAQDEAYLFDAYTLYPFRGKKLAPYIRYQWYKELKKLGRSKIYSITDFLNVSARKFKSKLNVQPLEFCLFIELFKIWRFHLRLKKYGAKN